MAASKKASKNTISKSKAVEKDERDERPNQYRVHKSYTRHHHRHHYLSECNSDSEEGVGRTKSSRVSEAERWSRLAAELGGEPPRLWYSQTDLSQEAARALWWGLTSKMQKTYAAVEKSYSVHCAMNGIQPPFPATVNSLASWIVDLGRKRVNSATIKSHLNRVRSLNVDMGYDDRAFDSPQLDIIIAGYCRLRGVS